MNTCRMCRRAAQGRDRERPICRETQKAVDAGMSACERYAISAKAYLSRIEGAQRRLEDMSYRAQRYRDMARRATGSYEAARISGCGSRSRVESNMDKCMDLAADIDRQAQRLRERYALACELIECVTDSAGREVLELRYLRGMRWEDIARRIGYGQRQIYRLHGSALAQVQKEMDRREILE